jgi:hypothetical protein
MMRDDRPPGPGTPLGDADREPYLRVVLDALQAGRLDPNEYTQRVLAINRASSVAEMKAAAHALDQTSPRPPDDDRRPLDPVDLARMRASAKGDARSPAVRYLTLVVVFLLFAVLIVMGVWLASHVHAVNPRTPGAVFVVREIAALDRLLIVHAGC